MPPAVGPRGWVIIATAGVGACFLLNAVSFVTVVYSLVSMNKGLSSQPTSQSRQGQLREGLSYVAHEPA